MEGYDPQKMARELLYGDKKSETDIARALEKARKERRNKPKSIVTRLVDRPEEDRYESYHEEMEEIGRRDGGFLEETGRRDTGKHSYKLADAKC